MASIDERVVAMSFENSRFEANIATTMGSLKKLDQTIANIGKTNGLANIETQASKVTLSGPMSALDKLRAKLFKTNAGTTFTDIEKASDKVTLTDPMTAADKLQSRLNHLSAGTTFTDIEAASDRVSFAGLSKAIEGIGSRFSIMSTAASVAMGNIAAVAAQKAGAVLKAFTLDPITAGFKNYETQINAVQTILANTGLKGPQGLAKVQGALDNLNKYANQTVYNFSEMTRNIGTFTAAGVKLGPAVDSIKGIANLAAMSGSSSEQASQAMYQLSQAIAAGKVGLQDWNSVVNAGMGGAIFQKALMRTAEALGTIKKGTVEVDKATGRATINGKSFRESIQSQPGKTSWLTSDVLVKTLQQFTGDMTDAQLASEGFNKAQIKAIQDQAKTAQHAATNIKTFSQLMDALKEEVATAWATIFKTVFGNINVATKFFSSIHTAAENAITGPIYKLNKLLESWSKFGGRIAFIEGLKQALKDMEAFIKPIKDAFRDIFPPTTGKNLADLSVKFRDFMRELMPSARTVENLRRTFDGLFALIHIGWTVFKDLIGAIGHLSGVAGTASGGILAFTGNIGDFLRHLDQAVSKGDAFRTLFKGLGDLIKEPLKLIKDLGRAIANLFGGADTKNAADAFSGSVSHIGRTLGPLAGIVHAATAAWKAFTGVIRDVKNAISPLLDKIADIVGNFGDIVANAISHADYSKVFSAIQTALLGGIFLAIKKALGGGVNIDFGGSVLKNLSKTFEALTGNLEAMQKNIQAHTLLAIAAAIGILAAGIAVLSLINPAKLSTAMTAVAIGMGELVGVVYVLNKAMGSGGAFIKMPFVAASMILLATSVTILAGAMKIFATMSWQDLAKGLAGVGGSLTAVAAATQLIDGPKVLVTAAALMPLAIALNILAVAAKMFATMSWEKLAKGLIGIGGALEAISLGVMAMPANLPIIGVGLIALSVGLGILSGAILAFGHMRIETMTKGILSMGAALVVLGLSMDAMPPTLPLIGAGLILVAAGMSTMALAIGLLGKMKVETLVKGLAALGGALAILAVGLDAMSGSVLGSVALLAAAAALSVLAPTLFAFGMMPWGVILKGLGALALSIGTLAVVGALAAAPLIALGAGIAALGLGFAAVGAAVYLFAKGISLLSDTSTKALAGLIAAVGAFIAVFPAMVISFMKGIVQVLQSVVDLAPKIIDALIKILGDLLDAIPKILPKAVKAIGAIITAIIAVLDENAGPIIDAGIRLMLHLLEGLGQNIGKITDKAVDVVTGFVGGLTRGAPKLIAAGAKLIISFLSGMAGHIPGIVGAGAKVIVNFLEGIARNAKDVVSAGFGIIASILTGIGRGVVRLVKAGANAIAQFLIGIGNASQRIINAGVNAAGKFIDALSGGIVRLAGRLYTALINLLNGLADTIRRNNKPLWDAGWNLAWAIIQGAIDGLGSLAGHFLDKIKSIAGQGLHLLTHPWEVLSPSKVTYRLGRNIMLGLMLGLEEGGKGANKSMDKVSKDVLDTAKSSFGKIPKALEGKMNVKPVITPVLDLSEVQKHASKIGDLMPSPVLTPTTSTVHAKAISVHKTPLEAAKVAQGPSTVVTFNQTNNSPDPLSNIEIYRQTHNQISRLKSLVNA
jgi:tape measure domain-containing protein